MPTYEYECKSCGHGFEVIQSMSDAPLTDCPECGKEIRRIIFGGTGVIFKGSGFYVTDKGKSAIKGNAAAKDASSPCAACPAASGGASDGGASCPKATA
jgi:putative FmdB family regulatory protein